MTVPRLFLAAILLQAFAAPLTAADLSVQIKGADGKPVRDAVVAVHLVGAATPLPRSGGSYAIDQQNIQFHPFVTVVPVGAKVSFLNHDSVRHQVYSFSPAKRFELRLEQRQQDRVVTFDKPGVVPLGCNIHDRMIAFIDVVDTPWAIKTDANGMAIMRGLPAGQVSVDVWHPYMRAAGNHAARQMTLTEGAPNHAELVTPLRAPPQPPAQSDY